MGAARFGELLGRFVPLSQHDVSEILEDQAISHRRFGEIALSWGLCRPDHIWRAWSAQLAQRVEKVDLPSIGIDTQALTHLDAALAREFAAIPLRVMENQIIVAVSEPTARRASEQLPGLLTRQVQFVLADAQQIDSAIREYYPTAAV